MGKQEPDPWGTGSPSAKNVMEGEATWTMLRGSSPSYHGSQAQMERWGSLSRCF